MTVQIHLRKSSTALSVRLLRWSGSILLFMGISALGFCSYVVLDAWLSQTEQSRQFDQALAVAQPAASNGPEAHDSTAPDLNATSPVVPEFAGIKKAPPNMSGAMGAETFPLGRIEISAIGLSAMIQEGTEPRTLRRGVGHIIGTSLLGQPGNIGLAGHRDTFFRNLRNLHEGDEITLVTLAGTFVYRVDLISIVEPQDSHVFRDSDGDFLTLVTCYPFNFLGPAPKRFVVRAHRVAPAPAAESAIN